MFVTVGARRKVMLKRRARFYESFVVTLLDEAEKLDISHQELVEMIERAYLMSRLRSRAHQNLWRHSSPGHVNLS